MLGGAGSVAILRGYLLRTGLTLSGKCGWLFKNVYEIEHGPPSPEENAEFVGLSNEDCQLLNADKRKSALAIANEENAISKPGKVPGHDLFPDFEAAAEMSGIRHLDQGAAKASVVGIQNENSLSKKEKKRLSKAAKAQARASAKTAKSEAKAAKKAAANEAKAANNSAQKGKGAVKREKCASGAEEESTNNGLEARAGSCSADADDSGHLYPEVVGDSTDSAKTVEEAAEERDEEAEADMTQRAILLEREDQERHLQKLCLVPSLVQEDDWTCNLCEKQLDRWSTVPLCEACDYCLCATCAENRQWQIDLAALQAEHKDDYTPNTKAKQLLANKLSASDLPSFADEPEPELSPPRMTHSDEELFAKDEENALESSSLGHCFNCGATDHDGTFV